MSREIVALVPVREGSQRVKDKNFTEFTDDNKSLLELKLEHLKKAGCFSRIYVSSDSDKAKDIAFKHDVEFLTRDQKYCQADVYWAEVVEHIMDTIPGDPLVVWALTTTPLFSNFKEAVDKYLEVQDKHDSLVAVLPTKSFYLNKFGKGINYNLGYWHPYSQELETYYEVTGACYIGKKSDMKKWSYWFGPKPYMFEVSRLESIDVDTLEDFEMAQNLIKVKHYGKK